MILVIQNSKWKLAQWLELHWWKQYLRNKNTEDYLQWKKRYWQWFLKDCDVVVSNDSTVLDAGCGPAGIFTVLDFCKVIAVDPLIDSYEKELTAFGALNYKHVMFQKCTIEQLEFELHFDVVFCINAINHVHDIALALHKLKAAMKPDARLIVSTDVHRFSFVKKIFRLIGFDALHPQQLNEQDFEKLLKTCGFKITEKRQLKHGLIFNYVMWKAV